MDLLESMVEWLESDDIFFIKYGFIIANFVSLIFLWILRKIRSKQKVLNELNVLLVTAHPDDEAMFFIPTIKTLKEQEYKIHLLCLSNGNADGKGRIREDELHKCAKYLQFDTVTIINDPELPDGMKTDWDIEKIKSYITKEVQEKNIEGIISFDDYGVSGHINHRAVSKACQQVECKKLLLLTSTNILRKYVSIFDFFLSSILTDDLTIQLNPFLTWKAMSLHKSQFVWYRKLFVIFSRYAYINTLQRIR